MKKIDAEIMQIPLDEKMVLENLKNCLPEELLGKNNIFAYGAFEGDMLVGIVLADVNAQEIEIKYIFVSEEYRQKGIGTALVNSVFSLVARANNEYNVVCFIPNDLEHLELLRFFKAIKVFEMFERPGSYYIPWPTMESNNLLKQTWDKVNHNTVVSLDTFLKDSKNEPYLYDFVKDQLKKGFTIVDSLLAEDMGGISKKHSFLIKDSFGGIQAILLAYPAKDSIIEIGYLYSNQSATDVFCLLKALHDGLSQTPCDIIFTAVTPSVKKLAENMFQLEPEEMIYAVWNGIDMEDFEELTKE